MSTPEPPPPPAPEPSAAPTTPLPVHARGPDRPSTWQPMLYLKLIAGLLAVAYVIAFVAKNSDKVKIDFVFGDATISLIFLILLLLGAGAVAGVLLSQLHRHRRRRMLEKESRQAPDALTNIGGGDEAVGKPG